MILILGYVVKSVEVSGNRWTNRNYILSLIDVEIGETLNYGNLQDIQIRLMESRLFRDVKVYLSNDTLKVNVKEFWYIWPYPIVDYSTAVGLSLGVGISHTNFRGYGENLSVYAMFGAKRGWGVIWSTPSNRFANNSWKVELGKNEIMRLLYKFPEKRTYAKGQYTTKIENDITFTLGLGLISISSDSVNLLFDRGGDRFFNGEFSIMKDNRDFLMYPTRGFAIKGAFMEYFGNFVGRRVDIYFEGYKTINGLTFVSFFNFSKIFGDAPLYLQLPLIGADDVVRSGIPKERLLGRERLISSFEVRRKVSDELPWIFRRFLKGGYAISLFFDWGYIPDNMDYSIGLGFPIFSSLGGYLPAIIYDFKYGFQVYVGGTVRIM